MVYTYLPCDVTPCTESPHRHSPLPSPQWAVYLRQGWSAASILACVIHTGRLLTRKKIFAASPVTDIPANALLFSVGYSQLAHMFNIMKDPALQHAYKTFAKHKMTRYVVYFLWSLLFPDAWQNPSIGFLHFGGGPLPPLE